MSACSGGCLLLVGGGVETPVTATASGGTHPTGMHSCFTCFYQFLHFVNTDLQIASSLNFGK